MRFGAIGGLALLLLAACTGATKAYGPDGKPVYVVECGVALQRVCFNRALDACPEGYRLLVAGQTESLPVEFLRHRTVFPGVVQMWVRCNSDE